MALAAASAVLVLAWPAVPAETGPERAHSLYGYPLRDADCRERCAVSWVEFRLARLLGSDVGRWEQWRATAKRDHTPSVGAVAWFGGDRIAFVEAVHSPTSVEISSLSHDSLSRRTISPGRGWPASFIHLAPSPAAEPARPDGEMQTEDNILVLERDAERLFDAA